MPPEIRADGLLLRPWRPADAHDVARAVRRQAAVFGGEPPSPAAGPVTLRPPAARDAAGLPAAYRDPDVIRWYGVPDPCTEADVDRFRTGTARSLWARGVTALGLRRVEWRAEVGNDASRRTAERAGFTVEGVLRKAGRGGRDSWVGSVPAGEVTP